MTPVIRAFPALAFVLLCLSWGSTFLALKVGLQVLPPLLLMGLRFVLAGGVLLFWLWSKKQLRILKAWRQILPLACMMVVGSYGLMAWGARFISSGMAAVVSTVPISLGTLLFGVLLKQENPSFRKGLGVGLGCVGLLLLFSPAGLPAQQQGAAFLMCLGSLGYAWGSVQGRKVVQQFSVLEVSALQMLLGGLLLLVLSCVVESWQQVRWEALMHPDVAGSLLYLVSVGSLMGFVLHQLLLQVWAASRVASYTFITPLIAVLLGNLLAGETLNAGQILAGALMVLGARVSLQPDPAQKTVHQQT
ncbi:DMT family transporter [Deinococcus roseus]|nr:EamA family transporter [Deinococcus roseus]